VSASDAVVALEGCTAEVCADDPVFTRGDGVFETLLVRAGRVCLLDEHLRRLAESAALVGLRCPDKQLWRAAADAAVSRRTVTGEAVLRLILGRGAVTPVAFAMVSELSARVATVRRAGVVAVTLRRPRWPLATAKSLSYAANSAAVRYAADLGAEDVVFLDLDGAVLEGPRSAVVIAMPGTGIDAKPILVTPDSPAILPSTTQKALFAAATARGIECCYRRLELADLMAAQGLWLLSSITLAARVHTLDGVELAGSPFDGLIRELIDVGIGGGGADRAKNRL
jgi:4-amino-4-deoxychorismate lyase